MVLGCLNCVLYYKQLEQFINLRGQIWPTVTPELGVTAKLLKSLFAPPRSRAVILHIKIRPQSLISPSVCWAWSCSTWWKILVDINRNNMHVWTMKLVNGRVCSITDMLIYMDPHSRYNPHHLWKPDEMGFIAGVYEMTNGKKNPSSI